MLPREKKTALQTAFTQNDRYFFFFLSLGWCSDKLKQRLSLRRVWQLLLFLSVSRVSSSKPPWQLRCLRGLPSTATASTTATKTSIQESGAEGVCAFVAAVLCTHRRQYSAEEKIKKRFLWLLLNLTEFLFMFFFFLFFWFQLRYLCGRTFPFLCCQFCSTRKEKEYTRLAEQIHIYFSIYFPLCLLPLFQPYFYFLRYHWCGICVCACVCVCLFRCVSIRLGVTRTQAFFWQAQAFFFFQFDFASLCCYSFFFSLVTASSVELFF